VLGAF